MVRECTHCHNKMEKGFVPDYSYEAIIQPRWQRGEIIQHTFLGMDSGIKSDRTKGLAITSYRCVACGYLEFFAE